MTGLDVRAELARDLDALRRQSGLSYRELAKASGCPASTLNDALRGRRFPRLDTVLAVARACGARPGEWRRRWVEADLSDPEPKSAGAPVPAQLPADIQTFTARTAELALAAAGRPGDLVVISGPAGVGKTALAVHVAHRLAGDYPDGQLFVDLHGFTPGMTPAAPADALARMLRALGVHDSDLPGDLDERSALLRSRIAGRRMLVVLDNVSAVGQVRPLLPGGSDALVLVTGRQHLAGLAVTHDARLLTVSPLRPDDAVRLLERVVGDRVTDEAAAARELVRCCGYLPLAVRIAAAQLASQPQLGVRQLADRLAAGDRVGRLELPGDEHGGVRAAFDRSYAALDEATRRLYRLLGLVPGLDFTLPVAAALLGSGADEADRLLRKLVTAHLVQSHGSRFQMHDLLRDDARTRSAEDGHPARTAALRRVLEWYLHTATATNRVLAPQRRGVPLDPAPEGSPPLAFDHTEDALAWLDAERHNLFEAVRVAADEHGDLCWKLTSMLWAHYDRRGHWDDWIAANTTALAATRRTGDRFGEALIRTNFGWARYERREFEPAAELFAAVVEIREQLGDPFGIATSLQGLAGSLCGLGRFAEARDHSLRALDLWRQVGDRDGIAWTLLHLGDYLREMGEYDEALAYLHQALAIQREPDQGYSEAFVLATIGQTLRDSGRPAEGIGWLEQAVDVRERGRTPPRETGHVLVELGRLLVDEGRLVDGRARLEQARAIFDDLADPTADDVRKDLAQLPADPGRASLGTTDG